MTWEGLLNPVEIDSTALSKQNLLGGVFYKGTVNGDAEGNALFIELKRPDDEDGVASASVPADFSLNSPSAGASFSRTADPIDLTWSPAASSGQMEVSVWGECVKETSFTFADSSGSGRIPKGALVDSEKSGGCTATLKACRKNTGGTRSGFDGGKLTVLKCRQVSILSNPPQGLAPGPRSG